MVAEFGNGGILGEDFDYDLLELQYIIRRSAQPQPDVQDSKPGLLMHVFESLGQDEQGALGEEAESASGSASANYGELGRISAESSSHFSSSSYLPFPKAPLYTPSQLSALRALAHISSTSTTPHSPAHDTTPTPYHFQFSPQQQKRAIIVYGHPDRLHVQEWRYSKRELKRACRDFGLRVWKRLSRARGEVFAWWVVSEVAGSGGVERGARAGG